MLWKQINIWNLKRLDWESMNIKSDKKRMLQTVNYIHFTKCIQISNITLVAKQILINDSIVGKCRHTWFRNLIDFLWRYTPFWIPKFTHNGSTSTNIMENCPEIAIESLNRRWCTPLFLRETQNGMSTQSFDVRDKG